MEIKQKMRPHCGRHAVFVIESSADHVNDDLMITMWVSAESLATLHTLR